MLTPESFGLSPDQLRVVVIAPDAGVDLVGVVTALEGEPLPSGDIASRLGGFEDVAAIEASNAGGSTTTTDAELIDLLLGSKNTLHNNYQDFQAFLDAGGKIGLQHDPLLYGAYLLNPFLVRVDLVPMLVVNQGEVAVIKGFVGLPTADTSGAEFKFGSIVRPGHRGIWQEPLRTGKYAINPRVYAAEIVPTFILTLNWADATLGGPRPRRAAVVDRRQEPRGLHLPDRPPGADPRARHEGTEGDLDGRHDAQPRQRGAAERGRQPLPQHAAGARGGASSSRPASEVQAAAFEAITALPRPVRGGDEGRLHPGRRVPAGARARAHPARDRQPGEGDVRGAAARRDVAHRDGEGQGHRQHAVAARQRAGRACRSRPTRRRRARRRRKGEAAYVQLTGEAEAARRQAIGLAEAKATEALGLARATGFEAQKDALGGPATAVVAVANAVADGHITVVPEVLVTGGGGGSFDGLAATLMRYLGTNGAERHAGAATPAAGTGRDPGRDRRPTSRRPSVAEDESRPEPPVTPSRRDVVEQLAAVVGRELDVAGGEGDAVEVLVAQHVAIVQTVREHTAEREAQLARDRRPVVCVPGSASGRSTYTQSARRASASSRAAATASRRSSPTARTVTTRSLWSARSSTTMSLRRRTRRVDGCVGDGPAQPGALDDALDHRPVTRRRVHGTRSGRRWSSGRTARRIDGARARRWRRTPPTPGCSPSSSPVSTAPSATLARWL